MTDREELMALFTRRGIPFDVQESGSIQLIAEGRRTDSKVVGYSGFVAEFDFNLDGTLSTVGIWE